VLVLLRYRDTSNKKMANPMEVVVAISEYINQIMLVSGGNCDNIKIIPQTFVLPYFMQQKFMI